MEAPKSSNRFVSLLESFSDLKDPRIERSKKYPLLEVLFLVVNAVISGFEEWEEIQDFGREKIGWLRQYLPYEQGIPSHDTLNRVLSMIDPKAFEKSFMDWASMSVVLPSGAMIQIDGKKLRGSATKKEQQTPRNQGGKGAVHLVNAWCSALQMCFGQVQVADKTNEISAIPELLDFLELEGALVSIDAMGCQKEIVAQIVEAKADYLIGLKENQPNLSRGVFEAFEQFEPDEQTGYNEQKNRNHGRSEIRICRVLSAEKLSKESGWAHWAGLKTIIEIQSQRTILASGKQQQEIRYYISSLEASAAALNGLVRSHWNIENQLHWSLDVQFGEDMSRKRAGHVAQNFAIIRKIVLNLIKGNGDKISVNRKRKKCGISDTYRAKTLGF